MGLSFGEIIVIAVVGLIFIGPKDLPRVMKEFASIIRKIKNMGSSLMQTIEAEVADPKKYIVDLHGKLQETFKLEDIKK